jgi:hypothetical protein
MLLAGRHEHGQTDGTAHLTGACCVCMCICICICICICLRLLVPPAACKVSEASVCLAAVGPEAVGAHVKRV